MAHIKQAEEGVATLFPEEKILSSRAPSEIPQQLPTEYSHLHLNGEVTTEWLSKLGELVTHIMMEQEKLQNLIICSISQNNVMGTVNATVISNLKNQTQSIEEHLILQHNKAMNTGSSGHQNPLTISSSQREKLDMMA